MEKWAHNHWVTATIYNCYSGADYFGKLGFRKDKNIVIPNCFPDIAEPIIRDNHSQRTIITVGRFDPQKDYETLIKSISLLDRKDYRLCIVGYGVLEAQIREWVELYGIKDRTDILSNRIMYQNLNVMPTYIYLLVYLRVQAIVLWRL